MSKRLSVTNQAKPTIYVEFFFSRIWKQMDRQQRTEQNRTRPFNWTRPYVRTNEQTCGKRICSAISHCTKRTHTTYTNDMIEILVMNNVNTILCFCKPKWRTKCRKQNKFSATYTHTHTGHGLVTLDYFSQKNWQFHKINNKYYEWWEIITQRSWLSELSWVE